MDNNNYFYNNNIKAITHKIWDFIIVGAGIAGLCIAESISRRVKASILLIDRCRVGSGASTRNAGRLTHASCTTPERAINARQSCQSLHDLESRLNSNFLIQKLGEVTVLYQEEEVENFNGCVIPAMHIAGLHASLIKSNRIHDLIPYYEIKGALAAFVTNESFVLHHDAVLYALMKELKKRGVSILEYTPVEQLLFNNISSIGIITNNETIRSRQVILCCGHLCVDFLTQLGLFVPIQLVRQQTLVTEPIYNIKLPIVRWTGPISSGSCHRSVRGEIIAASQHPQGDLSKNNLCSNHFILRTARQLSTHLPMFNNIDILRQWGGVTTINIDHVPFAGAIPGKDNIWIVFGVNAFTMFPMIAEKVVEVLLNLKNEKVIQPFALSMERGVNYIKSRIKI
jgi:glycine/D-amino acid oxidase-like deaminating enzyme